MIADEQAITPHKQYHGKITTMLRDPGELTREKLSAYYSPGVGAVSADEIIPSVFDERLVLAIAAVIR